VRVYLTGASGFVGSNLAYVFAHEQGAEVVAPPAGAAGEEAVPRDTRLDARATADALGVELPDLDAMLARVKAEVESSWCPA
jgi:nucleoside-diphosphate-sugar epimerase